ncbi:MAG TPA: biopolymer transporter ExbD [Candidatus Sulfotelmatobacter sp.]|nr:biopolymer transporter ExbD [Candidatus Sulfotelmatobacter sp.]
MKCLLFVCLMAVTIGSAGVFPQNPPLQKGVSVQMADTNNATPMPDADQQDAWIVAVTASGQIYLGAQAVSPEQLAGELKTHPRNRKAKLYIKADARASYAVVKKTLQAGQEVMFDDVVLLTNQPESPALGMMVPPKGIEVRLVVPPSSEPVVVRVSSSGKNAPELQINGSAVSTANLQTALNQALQNRGAKIVLVNADLQLPFAQVVHVIDAVRSVDAKIILPSTEM